MLYSIGLDNKDCPNGNGMLIEVEMTEEEVKDRVLKQLEAEKRGTHKVTAFDNIGDLWDANPTT